MTEGPVLPKSLTELKHNFCQINEKTIDIILGLHVYFNDIKKIKKWLTTKNPNFGNIAPLKLMQIGREKKVLEFINNALDENEAVI